MMARSRRAGSTGNLGKGKGTRSAEVLPSSNRKPQASWSYLKEFQVLERLSEHM
jgi:hypothetical protein